MALSMLLLATIQDLSRAHGVRLAFLLLSTFMHVKCSNLDLALPTVAGQMNQLDFSDTTATDGIVTVVLDVAPTGKLLTLNRFSSGQYIPVLRSYDGHDWENVAGADLHQEFDCSDDVGTRKCGIYLDANDGSYHLTMYDHSLDNPRDEVARFLERTTFGPRKSDLDNWNVDNPPLHQSFAMFMKDQIENVQPNQHKEFFRKRVNPEATEVSKISYPGPNACERYSRWRRYAFHWEDLYYKDTHLIEVETLTSGNDTGYVLKIAGQVRTVLTEPFSWYADSWNKFRTDIGGQVNMTESPFKICHTPWYFKRTGLFEIDGSKGDPLVRSLFLEVSGVCRGIVNGNPTVNLDPRFVQMSELHVLDLSNAPIHVVNEDMTFGSDLLLTESVTDEVCDTFPDITSVYHWQEGKADKRHPPVFALLADGDYAIHSPRKQFIENTIDNPAMDGGGNRAVETMKHYNGQNVYTLFCSNVQQNIFNEEGCRLSYEPNACSKNDFKNMHMLSASHLQRIHIQTGKYIYAIWDLRLSETTDHYPCADGTRSRWVPTDSSECDPSTRNITTLTHDAFADALHSQRDDNEELRDIISSGGFCATEDANKVEMAVYVFEEDQCFKTVHPDELSVYDVSTFQNTAESSTYNIPSFKDVGMLPFPNSITMDDFHGRNPELWRYIGRFGDVVTDETIFPDSHSLRSSIYGYSFQAVQDLGIQVDPEKGVLVCGSQGEVAPDPELGEHFDVKETTRYQSPSYNVQKRNVWTMLSLFGEDQLRQRVAWALSQILVVDPNVLNDPWATDPNTSYYDIFVRHALENYRDILREVAFHSKMAAFLTYLNSGSMAYNWYTPWILKLLHPDENFAREFLQLFSIGLVKLNEDGTPMLDRFNRPVPTFDTTDIVSFARAWTGFTQSKRRGNTEEQDHVGESRMDPLHINWEKRDWWPKRGLDGKFIGDRYPLCTDLPEKHFLKKGAKYRLLGPSSTPKWHYDPSDWNSDTTKKRMVINSNSSLYAKLCNDIGNGCTFDSIVTLDTHLECHEKECLVDTVRVVQLTPNIFYEYLRVPCVHLAFYENARQLSANRLNQANMCGNPLLASAGESCCNLYRKATYWNANRPDRVCEYTGERLTFESAIERCSQHGGYLCDNQQYVDEDVRNPQCYTTHYDGSRSQFSSWLWTRASCSLKALVNENGLLAVVHEPERSLLAAWPPDTPPKIPSYVRADQTVNFFSVHWPKTKAGDELFPTVSSTNGCGDGCSQTEHGECLCDTVVLNTGVFESLPTRDEVLSKLHIGAFPIDMFNYEDYQFVESGPGVDVYRRATPVSTYEPPPPKPYDHPSCTGNLVPFNHDFELGTLDGFSQVNADMFITSPGYNSSHAAIIPNRTYNNRGMLLRGRLLNFKCLEPNSTIRIQFDWQNLNSTTNETLGCAHWWECAFASVHVKSWDDNGKTSDTLVSKPYQLITPTDFFPNPGQDEWSHYSEDFTIPEMWDLGYGYKEFQFYFWGGKAEVSSPTHLLLDNIRIEQLSTLQSTTVDQSTSSSNNVPDTYSEHTVFKVTSEYGEPLYLKNAASNVKVGSYSLRNPPGFFDIVDPEERDAYYETDAVIDHVLHHPNTGPFLSRIIMQHLGISNPSPRYIQAAAQAFKSGTYTWTDGSSDVSYGDGRWGCLASTVAAIVLDREALSVVLDADPAHGSLKQPLLKVVGLMRSMDYTRSSYAKLTIPMLRTGLRSAIGQMPYEAPNVFSFFEPDYSPGGQFAQASLVSPEAQVLSMVETVQTSNGLFSLITNGLLGCNGGFGGNLWVANSHGCQMPFGRLELSFDGVSTSTEVINELASLLTSGRLSQNSRDYIKQQYDLTFQNEGASSALKVAQQLMIMSPEFQSTNLARLTGEERGVTAAMPSNGSPYKAIVYAYLFGGMDSFYMLSPYKTCSVYSEYEEIRTTTAKLDVGDMIQINATSSNQDCDFYGLHQNLRALKDLYDSGDAIFLANTGHLARPVNKLNWLSETRGQLFSHFSMMKEAEYVDAFREKAGTGVLGRMLDRLQGDGFAVGSVGINSAGAILDGDPSLARSSDVVSSGGISNLYPQTASPGTHNRDAMMSHFLSLNGATESNSGMYGNHWSQKFIDSANKTGRLIDLMNFETETSFTGDSFSKQLKTVAKMIFKHEERGVDRDAFYIFLGGFDHHFNIKSSLPSAFNELNNGIKSFSAELTAANLLESVTLVLSSEFGRTLTPNSGGGTDHAWGGNYFVMGGGLKGGRILGEYPAGFSAMDPTNDGRGRLIPTTSWDSLWNGIAQWFGVTDEDDLNYVLPNRKNFGCSLLTDADLYIGGSQKTTGCGGEKVKFTQVFQMKEARYLTGEEQRQYCDKLIAILSANLDGANIRCVITEQTIRLVQGGGSARKLASTSNDTVAELDVETSIETGLDTTATNSTNSTSNSTNFGQSAMDILTQNADEITATSSIDDLVGVTDFVQETEAPTESPSNAPSLSMVPSLPVPDADFGHFDIAPFDGIDVLFSNEGSTEELVFHFNISDRDVGVRFYEPDCKTAVNSTLFQAIIEREAGTPSNYVNATVKIDAKPENMFNSPNLLVVDSNTNKATMYFCLRMDMYFPDGEEDPVSINFHETNVTLVLNMATGFSIESVSTDREDAQAVDKQTSVEYYVDSYQCNSTFDREAIQLSQGSQLFICIETNSTQAVFDRVLSFKLNQTDGPTSDPIAPESGANSLTAVTMANDNKKIIIRTMVVSKFFSIGNSNSIAASGEVLFKFADSVPNRRHLAVVGSKNDGAVTTQQYQQHRSLLDQEDDPTIAQNEEGQETKDFRVILGIAERSDNLKGETIKQDDGDKKTTALVSFGLGVPCSIAFFLATWWFVIKKRSEKEADETVDLMLEEVPEKSVDSSRKII